MSPERRRCGLCGGLVQRSSRTWDDQIAYCAAHELTVRRGDAIPPDPLEQLPTIAEELELERQAWEPMTEPEA